MLKNILSGIRCVQLCARQRLAIPPVRFFSPAKKQVAKAQPSPIDSLVQSLKDEYTLEKEKYGGFAEGEEFIKGSGFALTDNKDTTEIKLTRNVGDKIVQITYQASEAFNDDDMPEMEGEEKEEEEGKEEEKESKSRAEFFISVKGKDGSGLLFTCVSENADLHIYNVTYSKDVESLLKESSASRGDSLYIGPSFDQLDEKLQNAFFDYLASLGVTDKLLAYIECSSVDKEQRLYMNWLQEMKSFVAGEKGKESSS